MEHLRKVLEKINIDNINETIDKFELFYSLLIEFNSHTNVTAITEKKEVETKHFIDSIMGHKFIKDNVLDIGAGAGFPAIPLAIINKDKKFTLVDSVNKKVEFIKLVSQKLELDNIKAVHSRIEDFSKENKYDTIVSRGVGELNILCEYCLPFIKIGGNMVAYKSIKASEEIENAFNALKILGGKVEKIESYKIESEKEDIKRTLIIIEKFDNKNDDKYPRGKNKPRKMPL